MIYRTLTDEMVLGFSVQNMVFKNEPYLKTIESYMENKDLFLIEIDTDDELMFIPAYDGFKKYVISQPNKDCYLKDGDFAFSGFSTKTGIFNNDMMERLENGYIPTVIFVPGDYHHGQSYLELR